MLVAAVVCFTSMVGDSALTWTLSVTPATVKAKSTFNNWPTARTTGALLVVLKPASVAVTSYRPGERAGKR